MGVHTKNDGQNNKVSDKPKGALVSYPDEDMLKHIKKTLSDDEEKTEHLTNLLCQWMTCENFPKNYEKSTVRNYLRNCRYDLEKTKKYLHQYYYLKNVYPNVLCNRNPKSKEISVFPNNSISVFSPNLTPNGERVYFIKLNTPEVEKLDIVTWVKVSFMSYDLLLREDYQATGEMVVLDGEFFTAAHFVKVFDLVIKEVNILCREAYPIRVKGIYIVNLPSMAEKMVTTFKMGLPNKIRNRVKVSKTYDIIEEAFPKNCLPKEYGGTLPPLPQLMKNLYNCLVEHADWFEEQENSIISEKPKGYNKVNYYAEQYGVEGSFRKLNLD